jgi:hypothetical protein
MCKAQSSNPSPTKKKEGREEGKKRKKDYNVFKLLRMPREEFRVGDIWV